MEHRMGPHLPRTVLGGGNQRQGPTGGPPQRPRGGTGRDGAIGIHLHTALLAPTGGGQTHSPPRPHQRFWGALPTAPQPSAAPRPPRDSAAHVPHVPLFAPIRTRRDFPAPFCVLIFRSPSTQKKKTPKAEGPSPGRGPTPPQWGPRSHDAVGEVLEAVVQFGGDGAHAAVHHLLHQQLQLLLRHVHVEALLQVADGAGAVEAGELRAWGARGGRWGGGTRRAPLRAQGGGSALRSARCNRYRDRQGRRMGAALWGWGQPQCSSPPPSPCCMISTICTTLSMCFRAAISPCSISIL